MSKKPSQALAKAEDKRIVLEGGVHVVLMNAEVTGIFGTILTYALSIAGSLGVVLKLLKLWVEDRKGRRIKIKKGDVELELSGAMSKKDMDKKIKAFMEAIEKIEDKKVQIYIPDKDS